LPRLLHCGLQVFDRVFPCIAQAVGGCQFDVPWRMAVRSKLVENKLRVYRDVACVSALEEFLDRTTRGAH